MPTFKGRDGEVLPSRRNPRGADDGKDIAFLNVPKKTSLCLDCQKQVRSFIKGETMIQPEACDKCKIAMKNLFRQAGRTQ